MFVYFWVKDMLTGKSPTDVLELITERHPCDVRSQLDLFCEVATSIHVHRLRVKAAGGTRGLHTTFGEVTHQFCLRALLWGSKPYYAEDGQDVAANVYNNGYLHSPFNALLRCWILEWMRAKGSFGLQELTDVFVDLGIPRGEVDSAVEALLKANVMRQGYEDEDRFALTRWGTFFAKQAAYDLPYIQTVWWDTPMLVEFDVGPPRLLGWEELERPSIQFEQWLRIEERLARRSVGDAVWPQPLDAETIWRKVSTNIAFSIHRIEEAVEKIRQKRKGE
jgi:hypothetical protein